MDRELKRTNRVSVIDTSNRKLSVQGRKSTNRQVQKKYLVAVEVTKYRPAGGSKDFGVYTRPVKTDLSEGEKPSTANNALPSCAIASWLNPIKELSYCIASKWALDPLPYVAKILPLFRDNACRVQLSLSPIQRISRSVIANSTMP